MRFTRVLRGRINNVMHVREVLKKQAKSRDPLLTTYQPWRSR